VVRRSATSPFKGQKFDLAWSRTVSARFARRRRKLRTFAQLLERTLGGMARLEALLALLGRAAMVVRLRYDGSHAAAASCFESEWNRRHFDCEESRMLGDVESAGVINLVGIDKNFI
jgi:hypothetical protein